MILNRFEYLIWDLIVEQGCMIYSAEVIPLIPNSGLMSSEQFAALLVQAEGIEPYELGTKDHRLRLEMFKSWIERHFGAAPIDAEELLRALRA
ncbi:MAG: hypothetical protein QNJ15_04815 [Erythrobacter sp.]|nr:hypothetical protein [Erythrobacter sp.]